MLIGLEEVRATQDTFEPDSSTTRFKNRPPPALTTTPRRLSPPPRSHRQLLVKCSTPLPGRFNRTRKETQPPLPRSETYSTTPRQPHLTGLTTSTAPLPHSGRRRWPATRPVSRQTPLDYAPAVSDPPGAAEQILEIGRSGAPPTDVAALVQAVLAKAAASSPSAAALTADGHIRMSAGEWRATVGPGWVSVTTTGRRGAAFGDTDALVAALAPGAHGGRPLPPSWGRRVTSGRSHSATCRTRPSLSRRPQAVPRH